MSNSNDCSNEEQMLSLLTDLQTENEKLRAKTQAIEPLIEKIQQQERSLTELSAYNKSLNDENEKLLKLSENERKLRDENNSLQQSERKLKNELLQKEQEHKQLLKLSENEKKLRDENSSLKQSERRLQNELLQKEQENEKLTKHTEDLVASIARLNQAMPTQDDIQAFSRAMKEAERSAEYASILYFANTAVIVVFALIVVFTGWQVYDTKREMKNVSEGVQSVYNAVYNDEGWSVFEGTITNEWVWSQNHPEAYQQYLQDKKQREQGLK